MKKYIIKSVFIIALFTVFSACEDFVDIEPKGQVFATSTDQLQELLYNGSVISTKRSFELHAGSDEIRDFDSEELPFTNPFANGYGAMLAFRDFLYPVDTNPIVSSYGNLYAAINLTNIVLESIDDVSGTAEQKDQLRGRALVFRANILLELVNTFARHYSTSYAEDENSGVVIPENSTSSFDLKRSSIQEVYNFIIADLEKAIPLLNSNKPEFLDQPNKIATYGYLARVYLYMGEWDLAKENAENALALQSDLYDYKTDVSGSDFPHFGNIQGDIENIIVSYDATPYFTGSFDRQPGIIVNPELLDLYESQDLRRTVLYDGNLWRGRYGQITSLRSNSGLTVPELMLIRAECNARTGDAQLALDDLNILRENRFEAGYTPLTDVSNALTLVKEERRRELAFNYWRLIDIKRYNLIDNDNISVIHMNTSTGETHTLSPGDNNRVLPIPAFVVALDPSIVQNPRDGN